MILVPSEVIALEDAIKAGRSVLLEKQNDGNERHLVSHGPRALIAVWRADLQAIATFIPRRRFGERPIRLRKGKPR